MKIRTVAAVLALACLEATTAKSTEFQLTIVPQLLTDFYGAGESADEFTSNFWNITDTGSSAPPMFSFAEITFTTSDVYSGFVSSPNASADIVELNNVGPIPQGDNLTPAANGWVTTVSWDQGSVADLLSVAVYKPLGPNSNLQWIFQLLFPPDSMGIGNAIDINDPDVSLTYSENNGANSNVMTYILTSATSTAPEPSTLPLVAFAAGLLTLVRYARRSSRS
jgi:hypothetical protein